MMRDFLLHGQRDGYDPGHKGESPISGAAAEAWGGDGGDR